MDDRGQGCSITAFAGFSAAFKTRTPRTASRLPPFTTRTTEAARIATFRQFAPSLSVLYKNRHESRGHLVLSSFTEPSPTPTHRFSPLLRPSQLQLVAGRRSSDDDDYDDDDIRASRSFSPRIRL
ncbi:hypothetical protein GQ607_013688 [Colletotrichum asianum]|uniref:Uncharacterized protein n=1 Tax=Colletotrichum asianum TaxID=702518 RepID=A0A8H3ZKL9_9PEZI|nr:hypothetical protein GQ607_013688 [Colletotrichum asianum]